MAVLNVGLLVTGSLAIVRKELGRVTPAVAAVMFGGLALYVPFTEGVAAGNINVGLAGIVAWAWVIGRSSPGVGVLAGVGAMVKVVPGALVFWSDRRSFVRTAAVAVAVAVVIGVVTLPITGIHAWFDFTTALGNSQPNCSGEGVHASLACLIQPALGPAARSAVIAIALVAGVAAVLSRTPTVSFVLMVAASVLPATDGHTHSLLVLYVLLLVLLAHVFAERSRRLGAIAAQRTTRQSSDELVGASGL